jgi:hypothetical protein
VRNVHGRKALISDEEMQVLTADFLKSVQCAPLVFKRSSLGPTTRDTNRLPRRVYDQAGGEGRQEGVIVDDFRGLYDTAASREMFNEVFRAISDVFVRLHLQLRKVVRERNECTIGSIWQSTIARTSWCLWVNPLRTNYLSLEPMRFQPQHRPDAQGIFRSGITIVDRTLLIMDGFLRAEIVGGSFIKETFRQFIFITIFPRRRILCPILFTPEESL